MDEELLILAEWLKENSYRQSSKVYAIAERYYKTFGGTTQPNDFRQFDTLADVIRLI